MQVAANHHGNSFKLLAEGCLKGDIVIGTVKWMWACCLFGWVASALADEGRDVYRQTCAVCHSVNFPGAPKLGDIAEWGNRLLAGRQTLLSSVLKGHGAMPPKGGDASLSDEQAEAALDYMLSKVTSPQ